MIDEHPQQFFRLVLGHAVGLDRVVVPYDAPAAALGEPYVTDEVIVDVRVEATLSGAVAGVDAGEPKAIGRERHASHDTPEGRIG